MKGRSSIVHRGRDTMSYSKWFLVLLFVSLTAFYAQNVNAESLPQSKIAVTLNVKNATVKEVLAEIQSKTGLNAIYNASLIDVTRKVTISVDKKDIGEVLNLMFAGKGVSYKIEDNQIILSKTTSEIKSKGAGQTRTVTGKVVDENGETIPGVNIFLKENPSKGTITDVQGKFSIKIDENTTELLVSSVGFAQQIVSIAGKTAVTVNLKSDSKKIDEVVVIGYGTQKKVNVTGAVATVGGKDLDNRPIANITQGLQGMAPNLNVSVSSLGGEPGATMDLNIRGTTSISGGSPYVLVDGVPQDLNNVNPADVESISILKDAASAAIYGAQATYGVILVTTKKGKKDEKFSVSVTANSSWNRPTTTPNRPTSVQFANYINASAQNSGGAKVFSDAAVAKMQRYLDGLTDSTLTVNANNTYSFANSSANTNWYKEFYKKFAYNQTYNINIKGGSKSTSYFISGGLYDQDGLIKLSSDKFRRYNFNSSMSSAITPWMSVDLKTRYTQKETDKPYSYSGQGDPYHNLARMWPNIPVRDNNGYLVNYSGLSLIQGGRNERTDKDLWITASTQLTPLKGLKINADASLNVASAYQTLHNATVMDHLPDGSVQPIASTNPNKLQENFYNNDYRTSNIYVTYDKSLGRHNFQVMVGGQVEITQNRALQATRTTLFSDNIPSISLASGTTTASDVLSHWSNVGAFMRATYNYDEKYLLEFNSRYDGSSKFEEARRWGYFPSVSAGYMVSRERFWEPIAPYVSKLKLRASYGSLGNQNVSQYLFLELLQTGSQANWLMGTERPYYVGAPSAIVSSDLTWESASTFDVGFDAGFFKNRLEAEFDYYLRKTKDMFGQAVTLPSVLGTSTPTSNNAELETRGWELMLRWNDRIGDFGYNFKIGLSDYQSTITKYNNQNNLLSNWYVGQKIGEIWGYETVRLMTAEDAAATVASGSQKFFNKKWTAGDVLYKDLNGDGFINNGSNTLTDHGDLKVIGNSTPRYSYMLGAGLTWKGFDLNMTWQGVMKRDLWLGGTPGNGGDGPLFWGTKGALYQSTVMTEHLDYWRDDNPNAYYPKIYNNAAEASKNQQIQTRYLQDGSYIRLKNLQVGYNLLSVIKTKAISGLRIYVSGENLLTFSKISSIFDPEAFGGSSGSGKIYPLQSTFSVGLNLTF